MRTMHHLIQSEFDDLLFSYRQYLLAFLLHEGDVHLLGVRRNVLLSKADVLLQKYPIPTGPRMGGSVLGDGAFPNFLTERPKDISHDLNDNPSLFHEELDRCMNIISGCVNRHFDTCYSYEKPHSVIDHLTYISSNDPFRFMACSLGFINIITAFLLATQSPKKTDAAIIGIVGVLLFSYGIKDAVYDAYRLFQKPAKPADNNGIGSYFKNPRHEMPGISDGKENGYFLKGSLDPALKRGDCASPPVQTRRDEATASSQTSSRSLS